MKIYIAVIGKSGTGKETTSRLFKEAYPDLKVSIHHFSDPLNEVIDGINTEILEKHGLSFRFEKSRPNQQGISTVLRKVFRETLLGNEIFERAINDPVDVVFLDGVRRLKDIEMLRRLSPKYSFLLYIEAPDELSLKWIKIRADRPGDAEKTSEQFLVERSAEAERMIETLKPYADCILVNNVNDPTGFCGHLREQILNFAEEKIFSQIRNGGSNAA